MTIEIGLKEIPIFQYLDKSQTARLSEIFHTQSLGMDTTILSLEGEVPGLYIVAEGEVAVFLAEQETALTKIRRGGSFGEMSLIEEGRRSSASIVVSSPQATLLFCARPAFKKLLEKEPGMVGAFYRGAAELLSQRLRQTNEQVSTQINHAYRLLSNLLRASHVTDHLGKTRGDLLHTGDNLVGQLFAILPELEQLVKVYPDCAKDITAIQQKIEALLLVESQNFDKISQQLDLIRQYFNNIKRVLCGEKPLDIKGDTHLFDR